MSLLMLAALLAGTASPDFRPGGPDTPKPRFAVPLLLATKPGTPAKVVVRGQRLEGVKTVTAAGGVTVKLLGAKKAAGPNNTPPEKVGDSEAEVEVTLPKGFTAATTELTLRTARGRSGAFALPLLPADAVPEQKDAHAGFEQAQSLKLPAVVAGSFSKEREVDVYRFAAKAGERVRLEVFADRLGSPADAGMTVWDGGRRMVAVCDDTADGIDPVIEFTATKDGDYFVALNESHDAGGALFGYRFEVRVVKGP